jgi:hypothetical protein
VIDLTPIDKRIQKKLFQKMQLLNRGTPGETVGGLTHNQLSVRTPFIRMTSDSENSVILMGGELTADKQIAAGYNDIYGPRIVNMSRKEKTSYAKDMFGNLDPNNKAGYGNVENFTEAFLETGNQIKKYQNKFKRPIPGVKSIDVNFKGGVRALREATISWTCWSFEDITRLTPYFLAHGKNVLLEWGWVYGNDGLKKLPTLINKDGIKKDVFENYEELVFEAEGDFDFTYGIVSNYEYTTRDDGAFDCQTTITSVGTSILGDIPSNKQTENTTIKVDRQKLREVTSDKATDEDLISFDVGVTLKYFIQNLLQYISQNRFKKQGKKTVLKSNIIPKEFGKTFEIGTGQFKTIDKAKTTKGTFYVRPNAYIYQSSEVLGRKAWVRWGWFEDNILSKFLTIVPENKDKPHITEFQSKEEKRDDEGKKTGKLESTRIRNHKNLETVNINHYILPGKLKMFAPKKKSVELSEELNNKEIGDSERHIALESITNEYFDKFDTDDEKHGYFRNILIPVEVLKKCFDVDTEFTPSPINLREALEEMFTYLNQEIPFWQLELTQDESNPNRVKIIDRQVTAVTFEKNKKINSTLQKDIGTRSTFVNNKVKNNGVFFFPVWNSNSMVKRQNVTTKIPDAVKLSIMYGSSYDASKSNGEVPAEATDIAAVCISKLFSDQGSISKNFKNLDISLGQEGYEKIGSNPVDDNENKITSDGSTDNIITFINNNSAKLKKSYSDKLKEIDEQIYANRDKEIFDAIERQSNLDSSSPYPTPDYLYKEYYNEFLELYRSEDYTELYNSKFYKDGVMKEQFIDFISTQVSLVTSNNSADTDKPIIIPFDLELEIDGTGGILPGNSFHSTYLPVRYQEEVMFQIFDVNHKVATDGWSVTLSGVMRTTFAKAERALNKATDLKLDIKKLVQDKVKANFFSAQTAGEQADSRVGKSEVKDSVYGDKASNKVFDGQSPSFNTRFRITETLSVDNTRTADDVD